MRNAGGYVFSWGYVDLCYTGTSAHVQDAYRIRLLDPRRYLLRGVLFYHT